MSPHHCWGCWTADKKNFSGFLADLVDPHPGGRAVSGRVFGKNGLVCLGQEEMLPGGSFPKAKKNVGKFRHFERHFKILFYNVGQSLGTSNHLHN